MALAIEIPCEDGNLELIVRPAEISDSRALIYLLLELEQETEYLVIDRYMDVEQQKALINQYDQSMNSIYLVIESDDQFVGIATLAGSQLPLQSHRATLGIALLEDYWGYGIGSLLVEELLDFAAHSNIEMITLEVVSENIKAINLYKKYKFNEVGRFSNYLKYKHLTYDAVLMERIVEPE